MKYYTESGEERVIVDDRGELFVRPIPSNQPPAFSGDRYRYKTSVAAALSTAEWNSMSASIKNEEDGFREAWQASYERRQRLGLKTKEQGPEDWHKFDISPVRDVVKTGELMAKEIVKIIEQTKVAFVKPEIKDSTAKLANRILIGVAGLLLLLGVATYFVI